MFTGLIEHTGIVRRIERKDAGASITIEIGQLPQAGVGDSIAVNGACLTLTSVVNDRYAFDVSSETIRKTGFAHSRSGDVANVELPLRLSDRLHGHIVNGHVDCTAAVYGMRPSGRYHIVTFELSERTHYLVEKGFIAVDGISVTPYDIRERLFTIAVIPYTYEHTNLKGRKVGDIVNIEFDIIAKYMESMLKRGSDNKITEAFLKERGFA
ncbi:MAG: riboflavin synthase [Deltaproteobacteria bacterium]|nr:riboflavin synthase [Deltaproteobacteria bacterium]MCL5276490.1 riboflavin synthase [Deltaproteobacteria bacterium]